MIFSTRYWGLVPFTVLASETVRFAILDMDTNYQSLSISNLVPRIRKKRSHETMHRTATAANHSGCFKLELLKFVKCWQFFFFQELNSKGLYLNSQKENRCHGCSQFLHKNAKLGSRRRSRAVTAKKDVQKCVHV